MGVAAICQSKGDLINVERRRTFQLSTQLVRSGTRDANHRERVGQ
jgi:hypothetical protein